MPPGARKKNQKTSNKNAQLRGSGSGYAVSSGPDRYDGRALTNRGTVLNPEAPTRAKGIVKNLHER